MTVQAIVVPDHATLAAAVAARVITRLADRLSESADAHLVLTGGTIGTDSLAAIATSPAVAAVDWGRVHIWWGDERFEPTGSPERNETGARERFLDDVPVRPENVHPMPASGGPWGDDVDAAAAHYAGEVLAAGAGTLPAWDILMLGVGPDGHVASLFPGLPQVMAQGVAVGVTGSPKPPPTRISLTLAAINAAKEVWLVASGGEKSDAIGRAITLGPESGLPSGMVRGTERTLALLDRAAAAGLAAG